VTSALMGNFRIKPAQCQAEQRFIVRREEGESDDIISKEKSGGVRFPKSKNSLKLVVYLACSSLRRFYCFSPFCRVLESATYVLSVHLKGSTPSLMVRNSYKLIVVALEDSMSHDPVSG
jgi:hypothetical protein